MGVAEHGVWKTRGDEETHVVRERRQRFYDFFEVPETAVPLSLMSIASMRWRYGLFLAVVFVSFSLYFGWMSWQRDGGRPDVPPPPGDTHDYDSIAVGLLHGHGFLADFADPEFRRPYEAANGDGTYDELLARTFRQRAENRPPLLPVMVAATYRVFGRSFLAWQLVNSVLTALGLTIVCAVAWHAFGSRVALLSAGMMFISGSYVEQVAFLVMMSETLAILVIALLVVMLSRLAATKSVRTAVACGALAGLLVLARTIFVLWLPLLPLLAAWIVVRAAGSRRQAVLVAVTVFGVACAVQLPWWIRNCIVLGAFMPTGTQGRTGLYAAYSDAAVHRVRWWGPPREEMQTAFTPQLGKPCAASDDRSLAQCEPKGAWTWIKQNPLKVPLLAFRKVQMTINDLPDVGPGWRLFIGALAAPFVLWRRRKFVDTTTVTILAAFILFDFAAIAVTWTVGWRFAVPVEPLISIAVAIALAAMLFGESAVAREERTIA